MPFGSVNPIYSPYGQFVFNSTHRRKPLCSVAFGHIARGSGRLNGSRDRCEVNHVSLLTENPLGFELGVNLSFFIELKSTAYEKCGPVNYHHSATNIELRKYHIVENILDTEST
ncbi:hypothetical protein AVEN_203114-1 [Araneus ventricosus]|uniref:Uncharacterized protein n=1 Tax=Araneus ventricosus TaxID=182803 RepID=A0A4Y2DRQ5_ARAVE|nr:hypothetical protein AVEN_203114-1 [Araneus ventricosus]